MVIWKFGKTSEAAPPLSTENQWPILDLVIWAKQFCQTSDHVVINFYEDCENAEDDGAHLSCLDVPDGDHVPANPLVDEDCIRPT